MRIALLEDDRDQAAVVSGWITDAGHSCLHFDNSQDFLRTALRESFDLLILDWVVPQMSGLEVLKRVRDSARDYTPVILVTAKDAEEDIVKGLESGADDYMTKPLRHRELLARVNAAARRVHGGKGADDIPDCSPYSFDGAQKTIALHDEKVSLTHREFDLAMFMFRNAGRVVSRNHILESIWGMHGADLNTRTVDTHISRLRKKLKIIEENGWRLSAIYQHGYRLERLREEPGAD